MPAMRVTREYPPLVSIPNREIHRVGIVAQHDCGPCCFQEWGHVLPIKLIRQEIVHTHDPKALDFVNFIAQHSDSELSDNIDDSGSHLRMCPIGTVIVIAECGQCCKSTQGEIAIDRSHPLESSPMTSHEIACRDNDIRLQLCDPPEDGCHVLVIHLTTHMNVGELDQRSTDQRGRQASNRQSPVHKLHPERFYPKRIDPEPGSGKERRC